MSNEDLAKLLRYTLRSVGPVGLSELISGLTFVFTDLEPATIHDSLNNLLSSGVVKLSAGGIYYYDNKTPTLNAS